MFKSAKTIYQNYRCKKIVQENVFKRDKYNDRNVLEQIIIPYVLARLDPKRILDIGREGYEGFYNEFFKGRELWTMDYDPECEEHGAPGHHITDDAANVAKHFKEDYFDFILINGVLGWGLNNKKIIEKAFNGIFKIMRSGGLLVIGWNNFEDIKIFKPRDINALKKLKPYNFKPLRCEEFKCENGEHTYNFYIKL